MAEAVRAVFAIVLAGVGLSHALQPRMWRHVFMRLAARGDAGARVNGLLHAMPGLAIVVGHRVYDVPLVLFTLLGWAWVLKGGLYILKPAIGISQMRGGAERSVTTWRVVGAAMLVLAIMLAGSVEW